MRFQHPEDRREVRFVFLLAALLLVWTALPELAGRLLAEPGAVPYIGGDNGVYFGYIEQVRQGAWLFRDLYTTEPQPYGLLNIFWLTLGLAGRVSGATPDLIFFLARLIFAPVVALAALFAAKTFLPDHADRRIALSLALFGAGIGAWVVIARSLVGFPPAGDALPIDLWVPEMSVTLSALSTPHFLASIAVIITILSLTCRFAQTPTLRRALGAAVLVLALGQFHTYYVPLVGAVAAAGMLALRPTGRRFWQSLGFLVLLAVAGVLGALPYAWLSATDLTTILRNATNRTPMLDWGAAVVGGGFFLPLAVVGVVRGWKERRPAWRFLCVWVAVQMVFIVMPLPWQRKMTEALIVPLAFLAAPELRRIARALAVRMPASLAAIRPLLAGAALFVLFGGSTMMQMLIVAGPTMYSTPITPSPADMRAFAWIRGSMTADAVIAATAERSNGIAGFTGRRVYAGHWSETVNIEMHLAALSWLGNGAVSDAARLRFLRHAGITHVYIGRLERKEWQWNPGVGGLTPAFEDGEVTIYVVPPAADTLGT